MLSILATIFIVIGIMLALYFVFSLIMRRAAYVWIRSIAIFSGSWFDRRRICNFNDILKEEFYAYNHLLDRIGDWCHLARFVCNQKL